MTKAYSRTDDNGGRCERCNEPASEFRTQVTVPVLLGGGMGWGTMWVCSKCKRVEDVPVHKRNQMPTRYHWTVEDVCDAKDEALKQRTQREREDVQAILADLSRWTRAWREREAAEVGCGYGRMLPALTHGLHFGRVTGFEREPELLIAANKAVPPPTRLFHVESLEDLRYGPEENERVSDEYFDLVLTFTVLQHMPEDEARATIQELRRVSRQYILLCEETDETLRAVNPTGYSTWGRPWEWFQIEMLKTPCATPPPFQLDFMKRRRVEDGYPRKRCGTYMLFRRDG